jgi:hypothetical protein
VPEWCSIVREPLFPAMPLKEEKRRRRRRGGGGGGKKEGEKEAS